MPSGWKVTKEDHGLGIAVDCNCPDYEYRKESEATQSDIDKRAAKIDDLVIICEGEIADSVWKYEVVSGDNSYEVYLSQGVGGGYPHWYCKHALAVIRHWMMKHEKRKEVVFSIGAGLKSVDGHLYV
jgi:hypothetical protein